MASFEGWLVGRAAELAELSRLVESTLAGEGRAAFVVGEAGVGKTAVLERAAAAAGRSGLRVLQGGAQEREQACPFAFMSSCLGLEESPSDARRARVADVLRGDARYGLPGAKSETAGAYAATIEAIVGLVEDLCAQGPLALFLDDLQWADSASVAVLHKLVRSVHQLPLLVVGAHRPVSGVGKSTSCHGARSPAIAPCWSWLPSIRRPWRLCWRTCAAGRPVRDCAAWPREPPATRCTSPS